MSEMSSRSVGVVVIGRNEGERLIRCLQSVKGKVDRIVYVDSGSTDASVTAAERLGVLVIKLDMSLPFTPGRARNEGVSALIRVQPEVKYIQFVDGDCELVNGWIEAALAFIDARQNLAVACGRRRERNPEASIFNRLCDMEWATPIGETNSCGGDSLMRLEPFIQVGGFAPELIAGEEPELCSRMRDNGWKIWRIDHEMTLHDAAMTKFPQWWKRAVRSGYGYADVSGKDLLSASPKSSIYKRELLSTAFWTVLLPLVVICGIFINSSLFVALVLYPLQICRIAIRRNPRHRDSWSYAFFTMLGKFAAFYGMVKRLTLSRVRKDFSFQYK